MLGKIEMMVAVAITADGARGSPGIGKSAMSMVADDGQRKQ